MKIPLLKLDVDLPTPSHSHPGDGGVDLYSRIDTDLKPGERQMVPTGVALAVPDGYAGLVVPRSGMAARHGIGVVNSPGLLDSGYRGEIHVILVNHGSELFAVERGDRIAQLVVVPVVVQEFVEVEGLPPSPRGGGGFGSTGR
ncbi:MAG: dUTP diphosphatase [Acidimicrobiia bacterium]